MANGKNKKDNLIYRDVDIQKADHYGLGNSIFAPLGTMFFNIGAFFNNLFAHFGSRDKDTMDRALEDKDAALLSRSEIYEKSYPEAVKGIEKIAQDKTIGYKGKVEDLDDFIDIAKEMAKGTDEKKEGGFTKGVYDKLKALKEAKDNLNPNDRKSLKEYHDILAEVSDSLYEYQKSHNPWRSKGQKRKEFAKTLGNLLEKELLAMEEENPFLEDDGLDEKTINKINELTDSDEEPEYEEEKVQKKADVIKEKFDAKEYLNPSNTPMLQKQDEELGMKEKNLDMSI